MHNTYMRIQSATSASTPITCPFCSLLCDDLVLERRRDGAQHLRLPHCPRAQRGFACSSRRRATAMLRGRRADWAAACRRAAELLAAASQPLFAGLGTDVAGMQAALRLAERLGGVLDHMNGDGIAAATRAMQEEGGFATTLTELRNRADLLVFAGSDPGTRYPRFLERMVWNRHALDRRGCEPRLIYLGRDLDPRSGRSPTGRLPLHFPVPGHALAEAAAVLTALVREVRLQAETAAGIPLTRWRRLAQMLRTARYGVMVWEPAQLPAAQADLHIRAFQELLRSLNVHTRFAALPLGGSDGGATALNVCLWQSGYPLRVSFRQGYPEHNATRYSTERLLARGEADALLWISAFDGSRRPPRSSVPRILLLRPDTPAPRKAEVYLPVATPGVEAKGMLFRCDGSVVLPLADGAAPPSHPGVAETLEEITSALPAGYGP